MLSTTFWIVMAVIVGLIVIFATVYYFLPDNSFHVTRDPSKQSLTFTEALMASVSNQTLLGIGSVTPANDSARMLTAVQALITLTTIILFATSKAT